MSQSTTLQILLTMQAELTSFLEGVNPCVQFTDVQLQAILEQVSGIKHQTLVLQRDCTRSVRLLDNMQRCCGNRSQRSTRRSMPKAG